MRLVTPVFLLTLSLSFIGCPKDTHHEGDLPAQEFAYPEAAAGDVVDTYTRKDGTKFDVPDPYRWLEDPDAPETRTWIDAENALTQGYIQAVPERGQIHAKLTEIWNHERFSTPSKKGSKYFYSRNDGLQNQSVLYVTEDLSQQGTVLIDPNTFSEDGTVSLAGTAVSEDSNLIAYATSDGGSDWKTWRVRDVNTGEDREDLISWTKFSGVTWTHDNQGFFYSRYPEPENPLEAVNENNEVYYHQLGTPQTEDRLVFSDSEFPQRSYYSQVSDEGTTLFIYVSEDTGEKNRLYTLDLNDADAQVVRTIDTYEAAYHHIADHDGVYWFYTNLNAPNGRVVQADFQNPVPEEWKELIPEAEEVLNSVDIVGDRILGVYLKDAQSVVRRFELDGTPMGDATLPGVGSVWGFGGEKDDKETFFVFSAFTSPSTIYRYDIAADAHSVFKKPDVAFDGDAFETSQIFYASKDGTKIPMFLVHKKGIELDGANPTLLYGYGGFNIPLQPYFSVTRAVWLEMGGVLAVANLRGGGEYGEDWHHAGTLHNKQNVFDDFFAAAEWLIQNGYTSSEKLAIQGGSNGGLLVGASITQRPDLFAAALPAVGVLDMLRYHLFTIGWAWASDYGRSDEPEMFDTLYAYSPLHNVKDGTQYPATLITTGDHDDRVVPAHSFKFAAAVQKAHAGANPVLIRIETRAGHGSGKSTAMRIDEAADVWAFLVRNLQMDVPALTNQTSAETP